MPFDYHSTLKLAMVQACKNTGPELELAILAFLWVRWTLTPMWASFLLTACRGAEEKIMEKIGDMTDITFIGGSAGDDLAFAKTHLFFVRPGAR